MEEFKVLGEDCQVVVRTASGGNYVKAGVDIGNRSSLNRGEGARSLETIHTLLLTLVSFPQNRCKYHETFLHLSRNKKK